MELFLTSSPCRFDAQGRPQPRLNAANDFVEILRCVWPAHARVLLIASDPANRAMSVAMASELHEAFHGSELPCLPFNILDDETASEAAPLIAAADVIVLAGGHVPTQNAFFTRIGLAELICGFGGIVIGISAGSMNSASEVYAMPEEDGEATDPAYERWMAGLGLTSYTVVPHWTSIEGGMLDELRLFEDIAVPDSKGRELLLLPDGSFVHKGADGLERIHGEAWMLVDGCKRALQPHPCKLSGEAQAEAQAAADELL